MTIHPTGCGPWVYAVATAEIHGRRSYHLAAEETRLGAAHLAGVRFFRLDPPASPKSLRRPLALLVHRDHRHVRQHDPHAVALGAGRALRPSHSQNEDHATAHLHRRALENRYDVPARVAHSRS